MRRSQYLLANHYQYDNTTNVHKHRNYKSKLLVLSYTTGTVYSSTSSSSKEICVSTEIVRFQSQSVFSVSGQLKT